MKMDPWSLPWMIPVPIVEDNFVSLFPEHKIYSIRTDLSAVGAFSDSFAIEENKNLLWADMHLDPGAGSGRQLGAGRSGIYKNMYVKGMGRTQLAGHWHEGDRWHNSGHLLPSAAIQEFLISCYFEAIGLQNSIVPCTGILMKIIDRKLAHFASLQFSGAKYEVREIDRRFQAITVKETERPFIRFPNIMWAMNACIAYRAQGHTRDLSAFIELVSNTLSCGLEERHNLPSREPERFVEVFRRATEQMIRNLSRFRDAGVYWLAIHNNHTVDGRFLDLEAVVAGAKPLSAIDQKCGNEIIFPLQGRILGVEVVHYARSVKFFCCYFRQLLEFYRNGGVLDWMPKEREFAAELAQSWEKNFCGMDFWANSSAKIVSILQNQIEKYTPLSKDIIPIVHQNLRHLCSMLYESNENLSRGLKFRKANLGPKYPLEPDRNIDLYLFSAIPKNTADTQLFEFFTEKLRGLYSEKDLDRLMNRLASVRQEIFRTFGHRSPKNGFRMAAKNGRKKKLEPISEANF